ncbi:MMPL family transporter [Microbacterium sp. SD291]|uniref:MMPL family transporter n=1 Tax=Microbacterium sp. SD291 TaxID=2782007 RepID=UPI001A96B579|nr:MMPL family transporter [Microbacterium sp. SD291]MBO0980188.1 MMPL family transporter [Microbacterium sp. SD291]
MLRGIRSLPERLTSRRGAWVALTIGILALVALIGALGRASLPAGSDTAPPASESARAAAEAETFPDAGEQTVLLVATRDDGGALTADDLVGLTGLLPAIEKETGAAASGPMPSDDGEAAVIPATVVIDDEDDAAEAVHGLRALLDEHPLDGLTLQVTGGPAFGVDVAAAFDGADFTLLLVTLGIVALLLILTYRSPVLWIVPLVVVALADQAANKATAAIGSAMGLQFDTGIVSVLVFGAGTNYALLLVSRYRDELTREPDHRRALAVAWRRTAPAVLASNVSVVVALLTLALAVIPGTRGLGIASAIGLLIAVAAVLLALPPALAVCGRGVFWPFVPRVSEPGAPAGGRGWRAVATGVARRPWLPLVGGLALLGVLAAGVIGTSVGLSQVEKFRVPSESAAGLETLGEHFPPGEAQPLIVLVDSSTPDAVTEALAGVDGVVRVTPAGESADGQRSRLLVTGEPAPGTDESLRLVEDVRDAAHGTPGADALVGGPVAADVDARAGNLQDFLLVVPLVLAVCLLVLIVLLRALVAPVVLLIVNTLSAVAAIGAGAWVSRTVFGWDSLDLQVPLLSFLFLVALGIDYTIFLVHRARAEAASAGTTQGMVNAVASTGGVITSAGVVLAAVFAALGLLPLVTLGQIGLIVGIGVIVDTFVVRTLIVPALFAVIGEAMWLPGRAPRATRPTREQHEAGVQGEEYEDAEQQQSADAVR